MKLQKVFKALAQSLPGLTFIIIIDLEHEIVAHVKLKDKLTLKEGEDVSRKVKASIEKISGSQIKTVRHA